MDIPLYNFGKTKIAKINNADELNKVLDDPWLESEYIIIKPNWVTTERAGYTEPSTLRMFFEAFDKRFIVTESYCLARSFNLFKEGLGFNLNGKNRNWKWLMKGEGWKWLIDNPDWSWFREGRHWEHIKKEEEAFLNNYGFKDLFKEFNVDYVNVTEEVWNGRIADPELVKRVVESRFNPVHDEKLYEVFPETLHKMRGSTFISLARLKHYATFTLKNMFGMIPEPMKPWWHGPNNSRIAESIVDINKVYHSFFNIYGICEAFKKRAVSKPDGENEGIYAGKYNIVDSFGFTAFGRNLASIDSILLKLTEGSITIVEEINRKPIMLAQEELGTFDDKSLEEVKTKIGNWLFSK